MEELSQYVLLFKQLKTLAKVSLGSIVSNKIITDLNEAILASLYAKSVDLAHGIICMYEEGLAENAQILIRALFETNVNFGYYLKLKEEVGSENASFRVFFGVIMTNKKNYTEQDVMNLWKDQKTLLEYEKYFKSIEYLDGMKKYGFTGVSIQERAKKTQKESEYHMMYRNFSRNAHANDLVEYFKKIEFPCVKEHDNFLERDIAALVHSFLSLYQIVVFCNMVFGVLSDEALLEIKNKFDLIN